MLIVDLICQRKHRTRFYSQPICKGMATITMIARAELAVLDFNSGVGIGQATTKAGKLRFKQQFSKVTQSWVVKKIRSFKDRGFIQHVLDEIMYIQTSKKPLAIPLRQNIPSNIAPTEKLIKKKQ